MATYAPRPAWELRARAVSSARIAAPVGLGLLVLLSLCSARGSSASGSGSTRGCRSASRTGRSHDIPGVLRQDGSPPLYYVLLNLWMPLAGHSEAGTHALSLLFALLCVPVAWWGGRLLFGSRTRWMAAVLAAANPFITQYAQETRMYALLILLGLVALVCWLHAFATDAGRRRRAPGAAAGFAVAFAAMLYTHNWAIFFGPRPGRGPRAARARRSGRPPAAAAHRAARLRRRADPLPPLAADLPLPDRPHGAPWAQSPASRRSPRRPAKLLGETPEVALVLAAGAGLVAPLAPGGVASSGAAAP